MRFNWGTGILIFFIIFLVLAFTFIAFSFKQNNDLVTDDYYEQGANYSAQIEVNKRSYVYKDSMNFVAENNLQLEISKVTLSEIDSLILHVYYPKGKESDVYKEFYSPVSAIELSKDHLSSGRCIAKITWYMKGEKYYLEKDLFLN